METESKNHHSYRAILLEEYEMRKQRNRSYSLRAFSRDIGLSPTRVSDILNQRQGLSENLSKSVAEALGLNLSEKELFCNLVAIEHARSQKKKEQAHQKLEELMDNMKRKSIDLSKFDNISNWYNFAILELINSKLYKSVEETASRLNITTIEVENTLRRLHDLGLISDIIVPESQQSFVSLPIDIPSKSIKQYHHQLLEKAQEALYLQPVEKRDISAVNFAISEKQLKKVKEMMKEFRRKLVAEVEKEDGRDRLYCLSLQLFSLENESKINS